MNRLVPFPLLAAALFAMWILLTGFSPGHAVLAIVIALLVSRSMLALKPEKARIRFGWAMPKLAARVTMDIVRSNIAVARIILLRPPARRSGFLLLPIDVRSPYALALFAIIITATPGTLWVQHDANRHVVIIHVLDLIDEQEWIRMVKERYEALLMEIFE